jgi:undecaprenyl-phosphate galactose phosphotransferase
LTGLWQVSGRNDLDFDERLRLDIAYIRNRSFSLDLRILLRTVTCVVSGRGAN